MFSQAAIAVLLVSLSLTGLVSAQVQESLQKSTTALQSIAALAGKVLNPDGAPAPGIRVELQNPGTGIPVTSTYTRRDGTFALDNIPNGNYDVVAESTDTQVSDQVLVQTGRPQLELRFPRGTTAESPAPSVSVAQMLVPESARRAYGKARHAIFERNDYARALQLVNAALELDPEFPDALALRGLIEIRKGQYDQAQESLQRAVEIDPNQSTALVLLAAVYNHRGRFDDALQTSSRAVALAPNTWQGYLEMAKASIAKNLHENALRLIGRAEKLGGTRYAEVHLVRAYALLALRHAGDARHELEATLSREPSGTVADLARHALAQITTESAALVPPQ